MNYLPSAGAMNYEELKKLWSPMFLLFSKQKTKVFDALENNNNDYHIKKVYLIH